MLIRTERSNIIEFFKIFNKQPLNRVSLEDALNQTMPENVIREKNLLYRDKIFIKSRYQKQETKYKPLIEVSFIDFDKNIYSALFKTVKNKQIILQASYIKEDDFFDCEKNSKIGYYFDYDDIYLMHKEEHLTLISKGINDINIMVSKSLNERLDSSAEILKQLYINLLNGKEFKDELDILLLMGDISEIKSMLDIDLEFIKISYKGLNNIENSNINKNKI